MVSAGLAWWPWVVVALLPCPAAATIAVDPPDRVVGTAESVAGRVAVGAWGPLVAVVNQEDLGGGVRLSLDRLDGTLFESVSRYEVVAGQRVPRGPTEVVSHRLEGSRLEAVAAQGVSPRFFVAARCGEPTCPWGSGAEGVGASVSTPYPIRVFPDRRPMEEGSGPRDPHREAFMVEPGLAIPATAAPIFEGAGDAYLWNAHVRWLENGTWRDAYVGTRGTPGPVGAVDEEEVRFLHFQGRLRLLAFVAPQLELLSQSIEFEEGPGRLEASGVRIDLLFDGNLMPLEGRSVTVLHAGLRWSREAPERWGEAAALEARGGIREVWVDGRLAYRAPEAARPTALEPWKIVAAAMAGLLVVWLARIGVVAGLASMRTRVEGWPGYVQRTLANPRRREIYGLIQSNPGIQPYQVWTKVGGAFGVTLRALERLESVGLVSSFRLGKFRHFVAGDGKADPRVARLARPHLASTMRLLEEEGPATERSLRSRMGVSHATFAGRMRLLQEAGLVERRIESGRWVYRAVQPSLRPLVGPPWQTAPAGVTEAERA